MENNTKDIASAEAIGNIKDLIFTARGRQVLLDSDVARLYGYETKAINQTASRNIRRFPPDFRFQLTHEEMDGILRSQFVTASNLKSQIVTSSLESHGGRRKLPYAYTEQGIGMLSGLLKNDTAIDVSIGIMNAFVEMRKLLAANADIFANLAHINTKLLEHDHKLDEVFAFLAQPEVIKQNIFYKGQFYDAHRLVRDIIGQAKSRIIVIDNYADGSVLDLLTDKAEDVRVTIIADTASRIPNTAVSMFEKQYGSIEIIVSKDFHDRFIMADNEIYIFGASLKDLGKKCFGVFKSEDTARFLAYVEQVIGTNAEMRSAEILNSEEGATAFAT